MTKVVEIARTSEYWVSRAHKHRLAGRYDEAMALLGKTQEQYGTSKRLSGNLRRPMKNWAVRMKRRGHICAWPA